LTGGDAVQQLSLIQINAETVKPAEHWVTKSNSLVEGHYRLTMIQQKIVLTMASLVQPEDEDFKWYRLDVKHFAEILGGNNHDYREMVASVHNLMERVVTIYVNDVEYLKTHWVQKAKGLITGGNYVDVSFDPDLKSFFLHLKEQFTTYKLKNVMQLKSSYSIRIYELLKQYQAIGRRTITISRLREMLGITPKEYTLYGDFKRKVLLVAHKEVNEKTDISFDYRETKLSRKVNELEFTITKKGVPDRSCKAAPAASMKDKAEAREKKRVEEYMEKLTSEERERLTQEAIEKARQECASLYRDRDVPEPVIRGYMWELAAARVKKQKQGRILQKNTLKT
jgi:plasmid replication initiation protein